MPARDMFRQHAPGNVGMAVVMSSAAPLVLLNDELCVLTASLSFLQCFDLKADEVVGSSFFAMGMGEWNIPQLRVLLTATAAGHAAIDAYEFDLVRKGEPTMRLVSNAHVLDLPLEGGRYTVFAVTDITAMKAAERVNIQLVRDKEALLIELQHRVANSLQIIASVLMQSVRNVHSEESRVHLRDAHNRVMSIATLQRQLAATPSAEVAMGAYLTELCSSIGASMINDPAQIRLVVTSDASTNTGELSVSIGPIVTELVINALKHAFPPGHPPGMIEVDYRAVGSGWELSVCDDGVGMPAADKDAKPGLGTGIVSALSKQLGAELTISGPGDGTTVVIVHR